jgi:hypothetical protein
MEENLSWFRKNCLGKRRIVRRVLVGKPEEREHLEDLSVDGRIILKCILSKWVRGHGLD